MEELDDSDIWTTNKIVTGEPTDGGTSQIPTLKHPTMGEQIRQNGEQSETLFKIFFPTPTHTDNDISNYNYLPPAFAFKEITDEDVSNAIAGLKPYKAPGPNGLQNMVIKECADILVPYLGPIFQGTFKANAYPEKWKESKTIVLCKPGKADYTIPKVHRPIALMDTIANVLSSCRANSITKQAEKLGLLPNTHFEGRPRRAMMDGCITTDDQFYQRSMEERECGLHLIPRHDKADNGFG